MRYSVEPRDRVFVKGYVFLSFTTNMRKNISKKLRGKYDQISLDHTKKPATAVIKTASKNAIKKQ